MKKFDSTLWKILKFFQLHKAYRNIKDLLPASIANIVSKVTLKNVYMPLVIVEELGPKYEMAWNHLRNLCNDLGDYYEFGVSRGTSMVCMYKIVSKLQLQTVRLFGFDSFEGLPASAATEDHGIWKPGEFSSSIQQTRKFLKKNNVDLGQVHLIKGWFENTLNAQTVQTFDLRKASVIMVDCDIYSASKTALNFCLPMIKDYAVIFFDDWRYDITFGECKAYSELLNENTYLRSNEFGTYPPTGKIFLVHNTNISH